MRRCILVLSLALLIPASAYSQRAGSFIFGFDLGLASAVGDFSSDTAFAAGGGVSIGAELRYAILRHFSIGPFLRYNRYTTDQSTPEAHVSYNFTQIGGLGRLNLFNVSTGKIYLLGGGGMFTPYKHKWMINSSTDEKMKRGMFVQGGMGLCSDPFANIIYELEFRYNMGKADDAAGIERNFDFFHVGLRLSFNSKGITPPPRY